MNRVPPLGRSPSPAAANSIPEALPARQAAAIHGASVVAGGPTQLALRFSGSIAELDAAARRLLLGRAARRDQEVAANTARILARVKMEGDAALRRLTLELDGVAIADLEVGRVACRRALECLDPSVRRALEHAARNLETAHRAFLPRAIEVDTEPGVQVGRRPDPLERVGIYAPGGRARYPSSVLMAAIPARVAGVREIVLCSPPESTGRPSDVVLAAAELAGVDRVFAIGGAHAIGALAYGTASVPRVDRIVGPGNAYVAEAKLQVVAEVGIDAPAGPSEILIVAADGADPATVAAEMLAQAEHDPRACSLAIVIGEGLAGRVVEALADGLSKATRAEVIAEALAGHGGVLIAESLAEAIAFSNNFAPEHLLLLVRDPAAAFAEIRSAGAVFLGDTSSVAFGDYLTGGNHTLPTGGAARGWSGLSTADFVRWTSYQRVNAAAAARLAGDTAALAEAEGLPAHAAAARRHSRETPATTSVLAERLRPRAGYDDLPLYAPPRDPCAVDLSDNTNRFGVPPAALRELAAPSSAAIGRYPHPFAASLKRALADYAGVGPDEIATGCGSDDVIDSAIRAFAEPGERLAFLAPTFAMAPLFARMNGLIPAPVPLRDGAEPDLEALLATGARIVYVCSPNNPTGSTLPEAAIHEILARTRGLVILDEAYAEFAGAEWIRVAPRRPRLLVVRTLSKAFGLAGLRIGYAAGDAELVAAVEKSRGPFKVGALAERAAIAALTEDRDWVRERVAIACAARDRLREALLARGLAPLPSAANFVLVPVTDADAVAGAMRARGVAVRPFPRLTGIGDAVRITAGLDDEMAAALRALDEALECTAERRA